MMNPEEFRTLARQARDGDKTARDILCRSILSWIYGAARRRRWGAAKIREQTEDTVQKTLRRILSSSKPFEVENEPAFRTYVTRTLENEISNTNEGLRCGRRNVELEQAIITGFDVAGDARRGTVASISTGVTNREWLSRLLAGCSDEEIRLLEMKFVSKMTWEEIAARFDEKPETVRKRSTRLLAKIREHLTGSSMT